MFNDILPQFGITVRFVDATDPANFETYRVAPIDVLASPPSQITIEL